MLFFLKDAPPLNKGGAAQLSANAGGEEPTEGLLAGLEDKGSDDEVDGGKAGGEVTLLDTLHLAYTSRRMQLLIPALLFNGMSLGFAQGAFTTVFTSAADGSYAGLISRSQFVGYYGATFYLANSIFSFCWGKLVPALGRRRVLQITAVVMGVWLAGVAAVCAGALAPGWPRDGYTAATPALDSAAAYAVVFGSAALFALTDSVLESQVPGIIQSPTFFPVERERDAANSNLKMWQSLGFAAQFMLGTVFASAGTARSAQYQTYVLAPFYLLAYAGLFWCDAFVQPFDAGSAAKSS